MAVRKMAHPNTDERKAVGLEARDKVPVSSHTKWGPAADRADPVALLEEQDATREPDLVPVRHGRMMVSPFTFYRGAAKIMAADLKDTPAAGLDAQLCGDAHLSNFGAFWCLSAFSFFAVPATVLRIEAMSSSSARWAYQMSIVGSCAKEAIASR